MSNLCDPTHFDIDVDLAPLLGVTSTRPLLVSSEWYTLLRANADRPPSLQRKIEGTFRNQLLALQWKAASHRVERRRAIRVPLLSRVHVERESHLVSCDISTSGLRCSGRPVHDLLDIEFKVPGLAFPIAARAEVTNFKDGNVIPLAGLRFLDIEPTYLEHISRYVAARSLRAPLT